MLWQRLHQTSSHTLTTLGSEDDDIRIRVAEISGEDTQDENNRVIAVTAVTVNECQHGRIFPGQQGAGRHHCVHSIPGSGDALCLRSRLLSHPDARSVISRRLDHHVVPGMRLDGGRADHRQRSLRRWETHERADGLREIANPSLDNRGILPRHLAVISLLCRMLNPSRTQKAIMYGLGILLVINAFVCFGMLFGRCKPFRAVWDVTIPDDKKVCWSFWHIIGYAIWTTGALIHSLAPMTLSPPADL